MMKYETLEITVIEIALEDIIASSLGTDTPVTDGNEGSWDAI